LTKIEQPAGLDKFKQALAVYANKNPEKKFEPHHQGAFVSSGYVDESIFGYFAVINNSNKYLRKEINFFNKNMTLL
jgi:hypothetical protein